MERGVGGSFVAKLCFCLVDYYLEVLPQDAQAQVPLVQLQPEPEDVQDEQF